MKKLMIGTLMLSLLLAFAVTIDGIKEAGEIIPPPPLSSIETL